MTFAASNRFSHQIRDAPPRFEGMPSCDGHQFDPCIPHHSVRANRRGFRVGRNPRNSGRLSRRSRGLRTEFRPFSRVPRLKSPASLSPQNSVSVPGLAQTAQDRPIEIPECRGLDSMWPEPVAAPLLFGIWLKLQDFKAQSGSHPQARGKVMPNKPTHLALTSSPATSTSMTSSSPRSPKWSVIRRVRPLELSMSSGTQATRRC